jgi:hypothetical protein
MPIKVTCSNCGGVLHAPDDAGGKRGRCPTCGNILPIPAEAPRASVSTLGDQPAPKGPIRNPSFGDFALGPQVGPPPGGMAEPPLVAGVGRSSVSGLGDSAPPTDARRGSMPGLGDKPEPRRATDPFARKGGGVGASGSAGDVSEGTIKSWRRAKSGLGWVQFANFLFLIPALALPGYFLAQHFTKQTYLTEAEFPVLKLPQSTAIPLLVGVVPVILGLIVLLIGRLGYSNVPGRSGAKGLALLSVLATIVVLGGVIAICFPSVAYLFMKPQEQAANPDQAADAMPIALFDSGDSSGLIQRFGMLVGAAMLLVGEFWFASSIGRVGAHLSDGRTAGRSTRYLMLLGLFIVVAVGVAGLAPTAFGFGSTAEVVGKESGSWIRQSWIQYVTPQLDNLGEHRAALIPGLCLLGGLLLAIIHFRLVGAARGAIRGWLDRNGAM